MIEPLRQIAGLALAPLALAAALVGAYLIALTGAALMRKVPRVRAVIARRRFAILVPAHDEASVIGRLLANLASQLYPHDRYDVFVVADNCTDTTAAVARRSGAIVHERHDDADRAKGYALRWLLERVRAHARYDAYVVVDADSVVSRRFLLRMNARLEAGSTVVQSYYQVLNSEASTMTALREAALASLHYIRPLGRANLGLSCGLKGNGMCFDAATLHRIGWRSTGLAEDVELHLALVRDGHRVDFAPETLVRADMPTRREDATSQNLRWEAGRLSAARHDAIPLLIEGVRRRDLVRIDAAVEQLIPPLSIALAVALVTAALGVGLRIVPIALLAGGGAAAIVAHVVSGLIAVRAPAPTYLALFSAPSYIVWKLLLYIRAVATPANAPWVRTER
jgi:1,2-diacylglycerol 3-beta-glucosyltransferase